MVSPGRQRVDGSESGALLIEVLVTIVIVVIGLLGLLQMHSKLQLSEMESYQRTQAILLMSDMMSRMETNRHEAASYVTASPIGEGMDCSTIGSGTLQERDSGEWCLAIQGASETSSSGSDVGSIIAGRGCINATDATNREFMVTVVWQGLGPIAAPPTSILCGAGLYNTAGTECVDDLCRRFVSTIVRVANLEDS